MTAGQIVLLAVIAAVGGLLVPHHRYADKPGDDFGRGLMFWLHAAIVGILVVILIIWKLVT